MASFFFFNRKGVSLPINFTFLFLIGLIALFIILPSILNDPKDYTRRGLDNIYINSLIEKCEINQCNFTVCESGTYDCTEAEQVRWESLILYKEACDEAIYKEDDKLLNKYKCEDKSALYDKVLEALGDDITSALSLSDDEIKIIKDKFGNGNSNSIAVTKAYQELENWNYGKLKETNSKAYPYLKKYWSGVGWDENDWSPSGTPWSAAFISYIVDDFKWSSHSAYINKVYNGELRNWEFKYVNSEAIKLGDVVCKTRSSSNFNPNKYYSSHCDIVVDIGESSIKLVGGNVGDSVSVKEIKIDSEGKIANINSNYIGILRYSQN